MNGENCCDILCLPIELLLFVAELLPGKDVISFSLSCKRFSVICRRLRSLHLENYWNNGISIENFKMFLSESVDPILITEFNMNNCFWLPAVMLQNFIKKCINIEVLHISETKINCGHLVVIFSKCKKIKDLSFTLSQHDLKITQKDIQHFNRSSDANYDVNHLQSLSCFKDCHENLKKLVKLELVLFSALQEMTVFISFCDNLKELVLIPMVTNENQDNNLNWWNNELLNQATMKGKFALKTFILVNLHPHVDVTQTYRNDQEFLVFSTNMTELESYWNDTFPCPVIKGNLSSLSYKLFGRPSEPFQELGARIMYNRLIYHNAGDLGDVASRWYLTDPFENLDLSYLRSVREDKPILIEKRLKASQARLISCFFSNEGFLEFSQNHPRLKVLKLRSPPKRDGVDTHVGEEWNASSWGNLAELETLSIEPSLLAVTEPKYERPNRKRKSQFHDCEPSKSGAPLRVFPILEVIRNCALIAELEISSFNECDTSTKSVCRIDGEDLSHIAQCKLLKRLTLGNFFITDGIFLEEIIKGCTYLESLRLKSLGSPLLCCFTKNLCASLPSAKKLTTLSIFQRNMVPLGKLLDTMEQCPSLIRLGLVSPSDTPPFKWNADQLSRRLVHFCTKLPHLVAFFCLMSIPKSHSAKVTKQLQQTMVLKRPTFCCDVQASSKDRIEHVSSTLPRVHHEVLVNFQSRVSIVPYDYRCSLL